MSNLNKLFGTLNSEEGSSNSKSGQNLLFRANVDQVDYSPPNEGMIKFSQEGEGTGGDA